MGDGTESDKREGKEQQYGSMDERANMGEKCSSWN